MPYIFLLNIIDSIIGNYRCPDCNSATNPEALVINGMSSRGLDIHLVCPVCSVHSQLSAEVGSIAADIFANAWWAKFFEEFIKNGWVPDSTMVNKKSSWIQAIGVADIAQIDEDIKNAKTMEDLMG